MASILITGAASGIGLALARRALARGDTVFALDRNSVDLANFGPDTAKLHPVLMDVSDTAAVERGFAQVDALLAGRPLDQVVNAAGISPSATLELVSVEECERVMNVNALGSLRVLKASIPRLRGHGGRIVLLTSLLGQVTTALVGAYSASKHAVEAYADAARRETAGMNLHIIIAEPGVVKTSMSAGVSVDTERRLQQMSAEQDRLYGAMYRRYLKLVAGGSGNAITAEQAAQSIEKALFATRPATRYRFGLDSKLVCFLDWLLPDRWMDGLLGLAVNNKPLNS